MLVVITLTFIYTLILHTKFKDMFFDYNDANFNARRSLFIIEWKIKLIFFLENKFYQRKERSLTKYYCIRSKLTVFLKFLTFPFNMFPAVFNSKRLGNFKFTPNHRILNHIQDGPLQGCSREWGGDKKVLLSLNSVTISCNNETWKLYLT